MCVCQCLCQCVCVCVYVNVCMHACGFFFLCSKLFDNVKNFKNSYLIFACYLPEQSLLFLLELTTSVMLSVVLTTELTVVQTFTLIVIKVRISNRWTKPKGLLQ